MPPSQFLGVLLVIRQGMTIMIENRNDVITFYIFYRHHYFARLQEKK